VSPATLYQFFPNKEAIANGLASVGVIVCRKYRPPIRIALDEDGRETSGDVTAIKQHGPRVCTGLGMVQREIDDQTSYRNNYKEYRSQGSLRCMPKQCITNAMQSDGHNSSAAISSARSCCGVAFIVINGLKKLVGQDVLPLLVYSDVRWHGHFQGSTERALDMLIVILAEFQAP